METQKYRNKGGGKTGATYGPIMCCASTVRVDKIGEKAIFKYGNIEIIMPVFMNNIAAIGDADAIRKGIRNYRKMETEEKKCNMG